jgi:hypothetical protein
MGYDLYLRRKTPEAALNAESILQALREASSGSATNSATAMTAASPSENFELKVGTGKVRAKLSRSEGNLLGADLEVPFGAPDDEFRATLVLVAGLAARLDLMLVDPQRGAEITPGTADMSVDQWRQANRYALDTAGMVEDPRAALPIEQQPTFWTVRTKVILSLVGLGVLALVLLNFLLLHLGSHELPIPID